MPTTLPLTVFAHKNVAHFLREKCRLIWKTGHFASLQHVRIARNADRCNSYGLSDCPSVCPSVTFQCFVQTNKHTIVRSSASGRTITLVSEDIKFIPYIRRGSPSARALKCGTPLSLAKIWTIIGHNFETVQIGRKLVLFTNRKSHVSFQMVPKSVTLNDPERRNGHVFGVISPNPVAFRDYYVTVIEDTSVTFCDRNVPRRM